MSDTMDEYLQMLWPPDQLNSPPSVTLPAGYTMRIYRQGDESAYYKLMALAGFPEWDETYLEEWIGRILPESWFIVQHDESSEFVATAMGCHDHSANHPFGGALGWVAGHPGHAGKGLGLAVSAAVTSRLIAAGYRDVHLDTEDHRLAALKTYLKLGYVPFLYTSAMKDRWQRVFERLNWTTIRSVELTLSSV